MRRQLKALPAMQARPTNSSLDALRLELARARLLCRAWADSNPDPRRGDHAALFVREALEALALERCPKIRLSEVGAVPYGRLDNAAKQLARTIGRDAAPLPMVEAIHFLTSLYPALLTQHRRSELGAYYTPPALAKRLIELATEEGTDWTTARVLDPAAGAGAFLVQAALRMREAMGNCEPALILKQIGSRLLGLELDPFAAGLAQAALEIALGSLSEQSGFPVPKLVKICDTLEEAPTASYDLVLGNPPYGRVSLTANQRQRYARSLFGHANLYGVFTDIALRWTKPKGMIAYLTPTSFLSGQYYASLRGLLAKESPPVAIDFVHARRGVFEDVLQETLLAIYSKGQSPIRAQIHYLHVNDERDVVVKRNGTIGLPPIPTDPWLAPRDANHSALIARVEKMPARLADLGYSVSTGPLVWNRFKNQLREKQTCKSVHPLIWAESVTADGRFVFRAQRKNHAPYFKLEAGDAWLLVKEACVLVQRTTAKEQARRLIAAELPTSFVKKHGGLVIENHLNMIRAERTAKVSSAVIAALLNSSIVDELFRCMSGSVAVSAFELEALPMPAHDKLNTLKSLIAKNADRAQIEAECNRLYGGAI